MEIGGPESCSEKDFLRFSLDDRRFSLGRRASRLKLSTQQTTAPKPPLHLTRSLHGTCFEGAPAEARPDFPTTLHRRGSVLQDHFKLVRARNMLACLPSTGPLSQVHSGHVPSAAATTLVPYCSCHGRSTRQAHIRRGLCTARNFTCSGHV